MQNDLYTTVVGGTLGELCALSVKVSLQDENPWGYRKTEYGSCSAWAQSWPIMSCKLYLDGLKAWKDILVFFKCCCLKKKIKFSFIMLYFSLLGDQMQVFSSGILKELVLRSCWFGISLPLVFLQVSFKVILKVVWMVKALFYFQNLVEQLPKPPENRQPEIYTGTHTHTYIWRTLYSQ